MNGDFENPKNNRLEGIETTTGKNIAGMIIEFIEKNTKVGKTKTRGKSESR